MGVAFLVSSAVPEAPWPRSRGHVRQAPSLRAPARLARGKRHWESVLRVKALRAALAAQGFDVFWRGALFAVLALLIIFFAAQPLQAAETITAIEIRGNRTVEADFVRSHVKLAPGSAYDAAKV